MSYTKYLCIHYTYQQDSRNSILFHSHRRPRHWQCGAPLWLLVQCDRRPQQSGGRHAIKGLPLGAVWKNWDLHHISGNLTNF